MREWRDTARVVTFVLGLMAAIALFVGIALLLLIRSVIGSMSDSPAACATVDGTRPQALAWTAEEGPWHRSASFEVTAEHPRIRVDSVVHGQDQAPIFPDTVSIYAVKAGTALSELQRRPSESASTTTSGPLRTDILQIGSGVDGVNEERVFTEGRWELVSNGLASATTIRPCG